MSDHEGNLPGAAPLVFGVPAETVAHALRDAGLAEDAVVAVLGRAIARSAEPAALAADGSFTFQVTINETAPECALTYERLFIHPDFVDGVTVVQAGATPDEIGFNSRFHSIEGEFDSIARDLHTSSNCVAELRREVFQLSRELEAKITEIDAKIAAKGKDKDSKDTKEKDTKESKDKDSKDTKEGKEGKDKEGKDRKDGKDKDFLDKVAGVDKVAGIDQRPIAAEPAGDPHMSAADPPAGGSERTFISLEDRPDVEATALRPPTEEDD
ncbi:hypothetical protein HH310_28875 [Actinoplanes sp. TBRC 11911]|uniref:hypothetical protein n=1 Tax=Actinoplanes sp. TBRC 11911 TaxID=2729386 RepID=UPI00145CCDAE|nr:hypothetical protein [Actinoplanes sp. TBRC 11911]NMO55186.1 hypothetical protein [Actinoplanes sp. TBRC 11911]